MRPVALITGASAGIGEATAYRLATEGYDLVICARREEKLRAVSQKCTELGANVYTQVADLTVDADRKSLVEKAYEHFPQIDVLINNAGLALGTEEYLDAEPQDVRTMFEVNVFAVQELTKLILPKMIENQKGHLVFLNSVAGRKAYPKGSAYCGSKFALRAMVDALRIEIIEHPIRISSINPGAVETEFSIVRLKGDREKAKKVYDGMKPLVAEDIANSIYFVISRPAHVNISDLDIFPVHQVDPQNTYRKT